MGLGVFTHCVIKFAEVLFRCCLKPGHVIGSPAPLVMEIKPEEIQNLKKRFSGRQQQREPAATTATAAPAAAVAVPAPAADAATLEREVAAQGDVVRNLKAAKAEKKAVDDAVAKLLDLKKQLAAATGQEPPAAQGGSNKKKSGKKK